MGLLSIATTDNQGVFGYNTEPAGNYCKATGDFGFGGTSAATAQVAGVIALILRGRLRSQGAGSRLRFGWARRCSMRRITASLTMVSETSGSSSYSLARRRHLPSQPSVLSATQRRGRRTKPVL